MSKFGKDKHRKSGLTVHCKACRNKANREYLNKNPGLKKKINDRYKKYRKEYYSRPENKAKLRDNHLQSQFGLTHDDYEKILAEQNGVCWICKEHRVAKNKEYMAIDHCHSSGKIRGILCNWCNKALGAFRDDIDLLKNAIEYLEKHSA